LLSAAKKKTVTTGYHKNFREDNSNYSRKVSYLQTKLSNLRVTCVCTWNSVSFSLSLLVIVRPRSLCAIRGTRVTVGSRKLDDQPFSDFAALTCKTRTYATS